MIKLLLILIIGLVFESTGVVLLKKGMTHIGDLNTVTAGEIFRVVKAGATSPQILFGVLFEALFFVCLLVLMSRSDISFLWPLTGLSFVFATFAAMIFLGETVSPARWAGVALIVIGAGFISYSEHARPKPPALSSAAPASAPVK
jgi:drug/metabolite transporter (DMT)-like permease